MNGIEETDPLLKKIEIVGISQLVMNDLFYQGSMMPLAHGLVLLIQTSSKDITSGSRSNTTNFLEVLFLCISIINRFLLNMMLIINYL